MNPEIEELRRFAKASVTRPQLNKLCAALTNATTERNERNERFNAHGGRV